MKSLKLRILVVIVAFVGLSQMLLVNSFAAASSKISSLERERATLSATIGDLQNSIFEQTSLTKIFSQASTLGLNYSTSSFDFLAVPHVAVKINVTP